MERPVNKMRIVFMGTPDFAVPSLQALHEAGHNIVGVFTQPDRPAGRGGKITASPVKLLAQKLELPVYQPASIKDPASLELIKQLAPECIVVVAYGQILPRAILEYPPFGCVNVHASLLPAYRGAAPIHWAVINGESKTGVTTMLMDEGLDTGDILLAKEVAIDGNATTGDIHDQLMLIGAELLLDTLQGLKEGKLKGTPQPADFSYAPILQREDERLDWSWEAAKIHNRIRGLSPWPGAFTTFRGEEVKIWQSELVEEDVFPELLPEEISLERNKRFIVGTGKGKLKINTVQPAGKRKMSALDFYNGRKIAAGERFL